MRQVILQQAKEIETLQSTVAVQEKQIATFSRHLRVSTDAWSRKNWMLLAVFHGWKAESYVQNMIRRTTASLLKKDRDVEDAERVRDTISHRMMEIMNMQNSQQGFKKESNTA